MTINTSGSSSPSAVPVRSLRLVLFLEGQGGFLRRGWGIFECETVLPSLVLLFFLSNYRSSHVLFSWMVHTGCVFVAGTHLSKT